MAHIPGRLFAVFFTDGLGETIMVSAAPAIMPNPMAGRTPLLLMVICFPPSLRAWIVSAVFRKITLKKYALSFFRKAV